MIFLPDIVLDQADLSDSTKLLFGRVLGLCRLTGETSITNAELETLTGCKERIISLNLKALETAGLLQLGKGYRNGRIIRIPELVQQQIVAQFSATLSQIPAFLTAASTAKNCDTQDRESQKSATLMDSVPQKIATLESGVSQKNATLTQVSQKNAALEVVDNEEVISSVAENCDTRGQISSAQAYIYNNIQEDKNIENNLSVENNLYRGKSRENLPYELLEGAAAIYLNGLRIGPQELGPILKIRGVPYERIEPFVVEHRGRSYNDRAELTNLVRSWLKKQKPKTPKATLDERRQQFYDELAQHMADNPGQYSKDMYRQFFDYWSEANKSGSLMKFENETFFEIPKRLATWATNHKNRSYGNANRANQPVKRLAFVNFDDDEADNLYGFDRTGPQGTEMFGGIPERLRITLE